MMFIRVGSVILETNLASLDLKVLAYFLGTGGLMQARDISSIDSSVICKEGDLTFMKYITNL
jgi:hypothetical protein